MNQKLLAIVGMVGGGLTVAVAAVLSQSEYFQDSMNRSTAYLPLYGLIILLFSVCLVLGFMARERAAGRVAIYLIVGAAPTILRLLFFHVRRSQGQEVRVFGTDPFYVVPSLVISIVMGVLVMAELYGIVNERRGGS